MVKYKKAEKLNCTIVRPQIETTNYFSNRVYNRVQPRTELCSNSPRKYASPCIILENKCLSDMVCENNNCTWGQNNSIRIPAGEHSDLCLFHHSTVNFDTDIRRVEFSGPCDPGGKWGTKMKSLATSLK